MASGRIPAGRPAAKFDDEHWARVSSMGLTQARQITALASDHKRAEFRHRRCRAICRRSLLPRSPLVVILLGDEGTQTDEVLERVVPKRGSQTQQKGGKDDA